MPITKPTEQFQPEQIKQNVPTSAARDEVITITRGQWDELKAGYDELKRGQRFERPKRVTERIARIRFYEGKPVVWCGNVREIREDNIDKMVAWFDIKLYGEDQVRTVKYLDFLNTPNSFQVKIVDQKATKVVTSEGRINATNPDPHFNKKWQEFESEQEVVSYQYQATVEVLEGEQAGKTYTLPGSCLNL